jgi:hypothetical protein
MAAILDFRVPGIAYNHTFFSKIDPHESNVHQ